jgi:hypothetical protein
MPVRPRYKLFATLDTNHLIEIEDLRGVGGSANIDFVASGDEDGERAPGVAVLQLTEDDARELIEILQTILGEAS